MSIAHSELNLPMLSESEKQLFQARLAEFSVCLRYLHPSQADAVRRACEFAAQAHAGVPRQSGEPYVFHPMAVAEILAERHLDAAVLIAAILHDVIEDTPFSKQDLIELFDLEVAELVDGVSKLTQTEFASKITAQAENVRKMVLAMGRDLRVILIKLADRLHNMRTLHAVPPHKRVRIARETLDLYGPIAHRLGMTNLADELELLGFQYAYPLRYRALEKGMAERNSQRREWLSALEARVRAKLAEVGINASVSGKERSLWSIYRQMNQKPRLLLREVHDIYCLSISVEHVDHCYRVIGFIHGLYKPLIGQFFDYIATPKSNGHQFLKSLIFGPQGLPVEILVTTREMHLQKEEGVAAYWLQQSAFSECPKALAQRWIAQLIDMQRRTDDALDFFETLKDDIAPKEMLRVFTTRGELIELPKGAKVIDFAYAIHPDVGNTCSMARVNRRHVALSHELQNGETVDLMLNPLARPSPRWLEFAVTAKARASIRHYLRTTSRSEAIVLGKHLLEQALTGTRFDRLGQIPPAQIQSFLAELQVANFETILSEIGFGQRPAQLVAQQILIENTEALDPPKQPILICGSERTVVQFANCCRPIPGDTIVGHLITGRGLVIHRDCCPNVIEQHKHLSRWLEVDWAPNLGSEFLSELHAHLINRRGALAAVAGVLDELECNIEHIETPKTEGVTTAVHLSLYVRNRNHLAHILRRLRQLPEVIRISRYCG